MKTYLVFLANAASKEDFVAPVAAESREDALALAESKYPQPVYKMLTCYEEAEIRRILDDVQRWPGVPSKVQPPLEAMLKTSPFISGQQRAEAMAKLAQTPRQSAMMEALPPSPHIMSRTPAAAPAPAAPQQDLKSVLAQLKGQTSGGTVTRTVEAPVQPAGQTAASNMAPISRKPAAPAPAAEPTISRGPKSVVEIFKGMRS